MIAIKGMELPKSCAECGFVTDDMLGDATCVLLCDEWKDNENHRAENCPLTEIITCKDCKYYRRIELNSCDEVITFCEKHSDRNCRYTSPNFYCADGKRKE